MVSKVQNSDITVSNTEGRTCTSKTCEFTHMFDKTTKIVLKIDGLKLKE